MNAIKTDFAFPSEIISFNCQNVNTYKDGGGKVKNCVSSKVSKVSVSRIYFYKGLMSDPQQMSVRAGDSRLYLSLFNDRVHR